MKLISLNIENENHLERVIPFLKKEQADVICLQEVFKADLPEIERVTNTTSVFWPTMNITRRLPQHRIPPRGLFGMAVLSNVAPKSHEEIVYGQPTWTEGVPDWDGDTRDGDVWRKSLLGIAVDIEGVEYRIFTTHFTWSAGGATTDVQRRHMDNMLGILKEKGEFVLCGDFNAPRGREMWQRLSENFTDNIPPDITTTIDSSLHKIAAEGRALMYVIDGIFTTPSYQAKNVQVIKGISDHCAIIGEVTRRS